MANPELEALRRVSAQLADLAPPEAPHVYDVQMSHLFDMIPAMVLLKDSHGKIVRANKRAEELLATPAIGKNSRELFRDHERREALDSQVLQTGVPKRGELHDYVRPDGTRLWLLEDRIPHHDSLGRIDGVLVFAVDVTSVILARQ